MCEKALGKRFPVQDWTVDALWGQMVTRDESNGAEKWGRISKQLAHAKSSTVNRNRISKSWAEGL